MKTVSQVGYVNFERRQFVIVYMQLTSLRS